MDSWKNGVKMNKNTETFNSYFPDRIMAELNDIGMIKPIFRTLLHHSSLIFHPHRFIVNTLIKSRQL